MAPNRAFVAVSFLVLLFPFGSLGKGDPARLAEEARAALERIEPSPKNSVERGRLHEKLGDAELAQGHEKEAVDAFRQALRVFCAGDARALRAKLLKRLSKPARSWSRRSAKVFARLRSAWEKADRLEKSARKLPRNFRPVDIEQVNPKLFELSEEASSIALLARGEKEPALLASVLEVQGRVSWAIGDLNQMLARYREGAQVCEKDRCPARRRKLLSTIAGALERMGKLKEAYQTYAILNAEDSGDLPESRRQYNRSRDLDRVCGLLRKQPDAESCSALETRAVGHATFRDFSAGRPQPTLTNELIVQVHAEYMTLIQDCLKQAAKNGEIEPGETVELHWAVTNEGRVDRIKSNPEVDHLQFGACLKGALDTFRYHRFKGERKTVTLPLSCH